MDRRDALHLLAGSALAFGGRALAQPTRRIGWVSTDAAAGNTGFAAFKEGLRELGYAEGRDVVIDARWGDGSPESAEAQARALVESRPAVIVTQGPAVRYVREASLPIVFGFSGDPVAAGFVESFARPGRNMTGVSFLALDLVGKRLEILKEVVPGLTRVAVLANPEHPGESSEFRASSAAASALGCALDYHRVQTAAEVDAALARSVAARDGAVLVFPDAGMMRHAERVAAFSVRERTPTISGWAIFARRGNLLAYGPNLDQGFRQLATYVDRILKGARAADLPIQLPSKIELVINLRTARAIGTTVPNSLLLRADEVIG